MQGWYESASCRDLDPTLFLSVPGDIDFISGLPKARETCRTCQVRRECLEYALRNGYDYGIWGGLSELERTKP